MDIACPKCGEPWDMDSLHDEAAARMHGAPCEGPVYRETYATVRADFQRRGCMALESFGVSPVDCQPGPSGDDGELTTAQAASALYEMLGDDLDGAAAMLEDFELLR